MKMRESISSDKKDHLCFPDHHIIHGNTFADSSGVENLQPVFFRARLKDGKPTSL